MNKDQVIGKLKEAAGEAEEHAARAVGAKDTEAKGHELEFEGKAQQKVGDAKEAAERFTRKPG